MWVIMCVCVQEGIWVMKNYSSSSDISENEFSDDSDTNVDVIRWWAKSKFCLHHQCNRHQETAFSFSRKPGINVDLQNWNNPLEYFELFITPENSE
jgi:hypothetical protein